MWFDEDKALEAFRTGQSVSWDDHDQRLYCAASSALCCAHALSEDGRLVLGAQAGEAQLANLVEKAGFRSFRRATETPFNLILEARP